MILLCILAGIVFTVWRHTLSISSYNLLLWLVGLGILGFVGFWVWFFIQIVLTAY